MSECAGCDKGLPVDRNDFLGWYHYVAEDCGCELHSGQRYEGKCVTRNLPTKQGKSIITHWAEVPEPPEE